MPITTSFDDGERLGLAVAAGLIAWPEISRALTALFGHPDALPDAAVVWVALPGLALDIGPSELALAQSQLTHLAEARRGGHAVFVTTDPAVATRSLLFARLGPSTGRRISVVSTLDAALEALGRTAWPSTLADHLPEFPPPSGTSPPDSIRSWRTHA